MEEQKSKGINKGIAIRNKKRAMRSKEMHTIKPKQRKLCRFIEVKEKVIEKVNGKFKPTGTAYHKGLQVQNRLYLHDGSYKLINRSTIEIRRVHKDIPDWATEQQIERLHSFGKEKSAV